MRLYFCIIFCLVFSASQTIHAHGPAYSRLNATADSAETAFTNPAGMTRFDIKTSAAGFIFANGFSEFQIDESRTTTTGGDPDDSGPIAIPYYYSIRPLGEKWRLGLSANFTGGFGAQNGSDWAGRYYSDEFSLAFVSFTPSIAYPLTDKLSLGFSLPITLSQSITTSRINSPVPGAGDGKLEVESTEVSYSYIFSSLYEFSEKTRVALIYRSEIDFDSEPDIDIKRYSLPSDAIRNIENAINTLELSNNQPQSIALGLFHELDSGYQITIDAVWSDFSKFGVTEMSIVGEELIVPDTGFDDIYAVSVGLQFPLQGDRAWRIGALGVNQAIDDEHRSFSFALDRIYAVGVGFHQGLANGNAYNLNVNLLDTGESPIDTDDDPTRGRVAGKSKNHYAITVDYTYYWR